MKFFKDFSVMNAIARKQNLERENIFKMLRALESLGIFSIDNLNQKIREMLKNFNATKLIEHH